MSFYRNFNRNYDFKMNIRHTGMTSLSDLSPLPKCLMTVCPSSLHSCVQGTNFSPSEPPGELMSFGVSPVNYSDSDSERLSVVCFGLRYLIRCY